MPSFIQQDDFMFMHDEIDWQIGNGNVGMCILFLELTVNKILERTGASSVEASLIVEQSCVNNRNRALAHFFGGILKSSLCMYAFKILFS